TYKEALTELYKRFEGIQQYKIFSVDAVSTGLCRAETA
ncbi:hypothetical protein L916_21527, partial [Phytophthora nicotianae]